jgi:cyanophycinase-like exopeptidase
MFDMHKKRSELLGIGIDENTAIVVREINLKLWVKAM